MKVPMTENQLNTLLANVEATMIDLIVIGDPEPAKRLALLYDIDFEDFVEKHHGTIVFAKLKE